ncbi:hypothetical protein RHAB21_00721 [Pseudorhizobium halotolerans]|uniref:Major capsid protein n=1 Tax=Pseudorhizobium halotolerans TaxID=1233081 RepID=A0ABM8PYX2_9HYPH|nr:phage tail tube protein [Pseudorhizobium halotolerans]CAD7055455.1 hypothetical protein RHAB21_00721 [Pseudorhizobium halotolerans]
MTRFWRNRALLAKIEDTYGVDAAPTGAANAIVATNVNLEPLLGEDVSRDLVLPYMGHQGVLHVANYARLSFEVEIAGAGAAGTAPAYGPLLRSAGMAEVIAAGVDVQYTPISGDFEAATLWFNGDGVRHALLGARATFTMSLAPRQIPRFAFTYTGLLGTVTDEALPAQTLAAWQTPVPVNKANTTFSLHGLATAGVEGITMDVGGQIEPRMLINHESIQQVDRQMTGSAIMDAVSLAEKNWFQIAQAHTKGALLATHGLTAGNIVEFEGPAVQIGRPTYGESQRILNNTLPLMFTPIAGNDEFKITVK